MKNNDKNKTKTNSSDFQISVEEETTEKKLDSSKTEDKIEVSKDIEIDKSPLTVEFMTLEEVSANDENIKEDEENPPTIRFSPSDVDTTDKKTSSDTDYMKDIKEKELKELKTTTFSRDEAIIKESDDNKPLSIIKRFISIIIFPKKLFENIQVHKDSKSPLILIAILSCIYGILSLLSSSFIAEYKYWVYDYKYNPQFSAYIREMRTSNTSNSSFLFQGITSSLEKFIIVMVISAFLSLILMMITKILRIRVSSEVLFNSALHISIAGMLGDILYLSAGYLLGTGFNIFSLAVFYPYPASPLFQILVSISIFSIWQWLLILCAVKTYENSNWIKSLVSTFVWAIISVATSVLVLSLADRMLDSSFNMMFS